MEANDALSLRRAQATRELLISRGFDARRVQAVGRGERQPAVATDDEVAEPRNRRTEIIVR
jgi:outer membrane protein OmpA-like peptidoglycan-associated protein